MKGTDFIKVISDENAFNKEVVIDFILKDGTKLTGYVETLETYLRDGFKNIHAVCREEQEDKL